jgi:hypothetical protein
MEVKELLPKRVVRYIHEMGVRALDHLADTYEVKVAPEGEAAPNAVQTLVGHWKAMNTNDKEQFVERVAVSVVEVVAASAALPLGLKLGKKAAKAARRVIQKRTKRLRKAAKSIGRKRKQKAKSRKQK